jgi:hypothetical protein
MLMNIPTSILTLSATHLQGLAFFPKSSHRSSAKFTASAQLNPVGTVPSEGNEKETKRNHSKLHEAAGISTGVEAKVVGAGEGDDELAGLLDGVGQQHVARLEDAGREHGRLVAQELGALLELHREVQLLATYTRPRRLLYQHQTAYEPTK